MEAKLSPNYSHEKLQNPSFTDLIDVFEDLWRSYVFAPVNMLLQAPNGDIAAMSILCSYFEAIAGYLSGKDTNGKSKKYFVQGICYVFRSDSPDIHKAAEAIYSNIRCGLAHEGMPNHKVNYSRLGCQPFFLTYRKAPDGTLDITAGVVSIVVNPVKMCQGVVQHFERYLRDLRSANDQVLVDAFMATVKRQWALGTVENPVGITEADFLGHTCSGASS
jgi:hypothetical protein